MMLRNALLAATVLALPAMALSGAAQAQPVTGLYVAGGIGGNYLMDTNTKYSQPTVLNPGKLRNKGGLVGVASIGTGLGNGLRVELEVNGRDSEVRFRNSGAVRGGGTAITYGPMVNVLYDFNTFGSVVPYVGVGGGYVFTQLNGFAATNQTASFAAKTGGLGAPAAQAIAGVAFPLGAPGLALTAEYRFFATITDRKFGGLQTNAGVRSGAQLKIDPMLNHSLLVGLRYNFGVAPAAVVAATPAPAASVAPAPARSYLVFFDWDKSDLTARAQQIIAEAAQNSTRVAATRIDVAGHADKSGTPTYNQGLSLRRANKVAAELVRLGVPRAAISIMAFGDTKPLVPTAAGVREPQNRRVEIVLH